MNALYLVAIGSVPAKALEWVEKAAADWFPLPIRRLPPLSIPEAAYDTKRGQYQSVGIMKMLADGAPRDAARVLGVTEEFYGLPADESLLRERTTKEVLHELGHTFGLVHCSEPKCAMSLATHIELVDAKAEQYCVRCGMQVVRRCASLDGGV